MQQPGVEVRPIRQITGTAEFSEVFFDGARTAADNVVGEPGDGWKVAMGTLAFERGASTLGQQTCCSRTSSTRSSRSRSANGARRGSRACASASPTPGSASRSCASTRCACSRDAGGAASSRREAMITKLYWATWHRALGKLAMDVLGARGRDRATASPTSSTALQRLFLFTRADTIYAGTNQIQRNIIAERALGLPREPRADARA